MIERFYTSDLTMHQCTGGCAPPARLDNLYHCEMPGCYLRLEWCIRHRASGLLWFLCGSCVREAQYTIIPKALEKETLKRFIV